MLRLCQIIYVTATLWWNSSTTQGVPNIPNNTNKMKTWETWPFQIINRSKAERTQQNPKCLFPLFLSFFFFHCFSTALAIYMGVESPSGHPRRHIGSAPRLLGVRQGLRWPRARNQSVGHPLFMLTLLLQVYLCIGLLLAFGITFGLLHLYWADLPTRLLPIQTMHRSNIFFFPPFFFSLYLLQQFEMESLYKMRK